MNDYALIYQKGANGIWGITGRIGEPSGICRPEGIPVELNYDYALVRGASRFVGVFRPTGSLDWSLAGQIMIPEEASTASGPMALQKSTAVSPGSAIFRRNGTTWGYVGQLQPVDYGNGTGHASAVEYRDGVLLAKEGWSEMHQYTKPYVYLENSGGTFDHVGILETSGFTQDFEISNSTVFASFENIGETGIDVFNLPSPLRPAPSIVNDFNARDISGFQQTAGSQFALAGNVYNYLYRQSATTGESVAVLTASDWNHYQSIEADITPTAFDGADRYVGLAVRYVDIANNYYVTWRSSNVIQLKRKVNGAFVTLAERALPLALNTRHHVRLSVAGSRLTVDVDGNQVLTANDTTFSRGRAALLTYRARADFDNVYASPTAPLNVNFNDWVFYWYGFGRPFTELGGNWEITGQQDPEGMSQTTTTGLALAYNGVATENQVIRANMRLDSFATLIRRLVRPARALRGRAEPLLPLDPQFQPAADPQDREWRDHGTQGRVVHQPRPVSCTSTPSVSSATNCTRSSMASSLQPRWTTPCPAANTAWGPIAPPRPGRISLSSSPELGTRPKVSVGHLLAAGLDDPVQQQQADDGHEADDEHRAHENIRIALGGVLDHADGEHAARRHHAADVVAEAAAGGPQARGKQLG